MSDGAIRFTAKLKGAFNVARLLRRYPEKVSRTLLSLVKQEARGLSVELARNTRPFGFSGKARKTGEKAVAKDIGGVFALPSDAFEEIRKSDPAAADRFWANIQNRRFSRAENNLRQTRSGWKDLTVGRLDPKLHRWGQLGGSKPKQIVTSAKARETHIERIQKRVGFAKGSWINAGKSIGGRVRGAVQWITATSSRPDRPRSEPATARPSRWSTNWTTSRTSAPARASSSRSRWPRADFERRSRPRCARSTTARTDRCDGGPVDAIASTRCPT